MTVVCCWRKMTVTSGPQSESKLSLCSGLMGLKDTQGSVVCKGDRGEGTSQLTGSVNTELAKCSQVKVQ